MMECVHLSEELPSVWWTAGCNCFGGKAQPLVRLHFARNYGVDVWIFICGRRCSPYLIFLIPKNKITNISHACMVI